MSEDHLPTIGPKLIPIRMAGPLSGYSVPSLYRFASEGRLALVKRGQRTFVAEDELARFLAAETKPFVPGEKVVAYAGRHRAGRPEADPPAPRPRRRGR